MKVKDILLSKEFILITDKSGINNDIKGIFSSDLLSHVMGNANNGNILITVLNNRITDNISLTQVYKYIIANIIRIIQMYLSIINHYMIICLGLKINLNIFKVYLKI